MAVWFSRFHLVTNSFKMKSNFWRETHKIFCIQRLESIQSRRHFDWIRRFRIKAKNSSVFNIPKCFRSSKLKNSKWLTLNAYKIFTEILRSTRPHTNTRCTWCVRHSSCCRVRLVLIIAVVEPEQFCVKKNHWIVHEIANCWHCRFPLMKANCKTTRLRMQSKHYYLLLFRYDFACEFARRV